MSSSPRRRPAPATIRRRRLTLGAIALLVVIGLVGLVGYLLTRPATVTVSIALGGGHAGAVRVRADEEHQSASFVTSAATAAGADAATVTVGGASGAPPVSPGFVGVSIEIQAIPEYARTAGALAQLLANLDPGQRPYIRIGGDSTDHAWVPYPGGPVTQGLSQRMTPTWIADARRIADDANAKVAVGVDMEVDDPDVVAHQASALKAGLGSHLVALEVGNEPDLYSTFPWYRVKKTHQQVFNHTKPSWTPQAYIAQLEQTGPAFDGLPLWGPSIDQGSTWWTALDGMAAALPHLSTITLHAYPVTCYVPPNSDRTPTIPHLLDAGSSTGLVEQAAPELDYAHAHGLQFRIDETNTVSCAGHDAITGFASALWAIEAGFAFARGGINGVNIHTFPDAAYRLFAFHPTGTAVSDEYYGWMLFARAAPPGSTILDTHVSGGAAGVVADAARTSTATNVVLINPSADHPALVSLAASGTSRAQIDALRGNGLGRAGNVTFAGLSISPSSAILSGTPQATVVAAHGRYAIELPPGSADLVTLTH